MTYQTGTLTGKFTNLDGLAAVGEVVITATTSPILDATGNVVLSGKVSITLDGTGSFSIVLPATDDSSLNPTGFGYAVKANLYHATIGPTYLPLPGGTTVKLADVTPVDPSTFDPTATYASLAALAVETTARAAGDTAEATARSTADVTLQANIDTEAAARAAADTVLTTALAAKATATIVPLTVGSLTAGRNGPTLQTAAVTCRVPMKVSVAGSTFRLDYQGWYTTAGYLDADWPIDQTIAASIEDQVGNTIRRVTFAGRSTGVIGSGGNLRSDPIGIDLTAGTVYVRTALLASTRGGVGTTNTSATITDPNVTANDFGRPVSGTGIPGSAFVGTVTPGVGYTLSNTSGSQAGALVASATGTIAATYGAVWYPNRFVPTGPGGYGGASAGDLTATGSGAIADATSSTQLLGPSAIVGVPATSTTYRSLLVVGDSIAAGVGDGVDLRAGVNTLFPKLASGGPFARAMNGIGGIINVAVGGDTLNNYKAIPGHFRKLSASAALCHNMVLEYATNDIYAGRTLAQLQADIITAAGYGTNRDMRVFQTTCLPRTTSTDGWVTTANQTPANAGFETVRTNLNAWLRDGAPTTAGAAVAVGTVGAARCAVYDSLGALATAASGPTSPLYAVFDLAATVEATGGKWIAPTGIRTVADGIVSGGGFTLTSATAAFVNNDLGGVVTVSGAGTAGGLYVGQIAARTSGSIVTLLAAAPTLVGSGATVSIFDGITVDGVHPGPEAQPKLAAAIATGALKP